MRVFWLLCALLFIAPSVASSQEVDLSLQDELSFVSNDAFLIGIARPAKMFDVKAIADNPVANLSSPIGVKPSEVDYLVIALVPSYESASLLFSIKSKKPIDQENVRRLLSPRSEMLEDEFPIYDGQESGGMTLAFPKPDQLLFSQDAAAVFEALDRSPRKAQSGLSKMLEGGKNAHAQLVFDIAQLKHFVTFNSGEYRSFDGTIEKWFPPGTSQVQALLDLNTKIPFICKAFASKDVKEFQHAAQKSLDESKKQLELGNDESETAAMAAGMISGMRCSNIERGVLVQYERDGSLEEFVAGVLLDIKLARQMIARKADIIVAQNLIRRVVLGLLNFDSAYQELPSNIESKDGVPLLSWRVAILPMLGEQELYDSFKLDQSWDSDHNKSLLQKMPAVFRDPLNKSQRQEETRIQYPIGEGTAKMSDGVKLRDIKDGTSNTIAIVSSGVTVPWTKPADHRIAPNDPWMNLSEPVIVGTFDGSLLILKKPDQTEQLKAAFTIAAGDGGLVLPKRRSFGEGAEERKVALLKRFAADGLSKPMASFAAVYQHNIGGKKPPANAMEIGLKFIQAKDPDVIGLGLLVLGRLEPKYNWKLLEPLFKSDYISNRWQAISLVVKTQDPDAIATVFLLESLHDQVWEALHEHEVGVQAVSKLVPILKHENPMFRSSAGWALTVFGKETYKSNVQELLKDKDEEVRKSAADMIEAMDELD